MAGQLQAGIAIQRNIRGHGHTMPGQQVHGQRTARALQQVGRECQYGGSLRLFPQQLTQESRLRCGVYLICQSS